MSGSVAVHRGSLGFPAMGGGEERRKRGGDDEEEEEEEEEENGVRGMEAWERAYADERSWEALQEDESGLLRPIDTKTLVHAQYRRRLLLRSAAASSAAPRIQKGLIRYLYVVIDLSRAASEMDFRPSRMVVVAKCVEVFIREFFDQNPLSHIGMVTIKDGVAQCLTDLGGSPDSQIKSLLGKLECSGDASLQNALELVYGYLSQIPSYGHREVLILYSALNTCDPGDIMETVQQCKKAKIRCSVIGLSAEIYICKHLCEETGGSYTVALDESHFKELLLEHAPPPPAIAEYAAANLIRMGFPQRGADGVISICSCHKEAKVGGGYTCPRCKARVCELPTECQICGLTLVSSPHLARSYHHLFPVTPFNEVSSRIPTKWSQKLPQTCYGCQQSLVSHGGKSDPHVSCPKCNQHFCLDCDIYIHESLHNCPGCESQHGSTT
ncbi:general transcription factor IIH subunit 2-like isoform X1 [Phoenix dactylifera]|uniref:General transcription factor IIH subunit n=1 Tax=Phoenix dactylifera TaxID=42345 RepID=A0A8B8ZXQ9_PHODC|nr:general transcription factor IIH subunit 2-like isoform X1 [Phoenix dactylifera]